MQQRAFALKESAVESFVDAAVSVGGEQLRVGELLEQGDGVIVVDRVAEADALADVDVLKEVPVPDRAPRELADLNRDELKQRLRAAGLPVAGNKSELRQRLDDHEAAQRAADER